MSSLKLRTDCQLLKTMNNIGIPSLILGQERWQIGEVYFARVSHLSGHGEDVILHTVKAQHI